MPNTSSDQKSEQSLSSSSLFLFVGNFGVRKVFVVAICRLESTCSFVVNFVGTSLLSKLPEGIQPKKVSFNHIPHGRFLTLVRFIILL